jgi:hypothetical protein
MVRSATLPLLAKLDCRPPGTLPAFHSASLTSQNNFLPKSSQQFLQQTGVAREAKDRRGRRNKLEEA